MSNIPNVNSFPVTGLDGKPLRLTVSTDIVDYLESARTFGREDLADEESHGQFQRRMVAIPDHKFGVVTPLVLTIGSNGSLYLVRKEQAAGGDGWSLVDLGKAFTQAIGATPKVRALGASWTDDDRIALAVAVDSGTEGEASRVFVAYDVSSKGTDWGAIAWQDCGTRANVRVEGIRVLAEEDSSWTVALVGDVGRVDTVFLLKSRLSQSFNKALVFTPSVDYDEIYDFEVAVNPFVGSGIAIVGANGGESVLSFRPFPKYGPDGRMATQPPSVPLPCPKGAKVLETGVTRDGGTDLYIGGEGVYLLSAKEFDNQEEAELLPVVIPEAAPMVRDLAIADTADGAVVAWSLLQNGHLVVARRQAGSANWRTPLRLRSNVGAIAPAQGDAHATTSLLAVYTDGRAAFLMQDAGAEIWRESPLLVGDPGQVAAVPCYGTSLRVLGEDNMPKAGVKVKVSASIIDSVILNNQAVFIGPNLALEVETDGNGSIKLYDRVRSLTPPIYRFTIEGVENSIDVNPAGGVHARLSQITGDELRKAQVSSLGGQTVSLLPEEFRNDANRGMVDGVAQAMNQASDLLAKQVAGSVPGASQVKVDAAYSSKLKTQVLPDNYQWGIQADGNSVKPLSSSAIDTLLSAAQTVENFFVDLGDSIADFFEGLWERVKEGWSFIVRKAQDAYEFICELGGKIKRFILNTLEEIGSFFSWLWEQLKAGAEKVWNFLKFVFDWDDILLARDAMVKATEEALFFLRDSTGTLKEETSKGFDSAIAKINEWRTEIGVPPTKLPSPTAGTSIADGMKNIGDKARESMDQAMGNSVVGFVLDKISEAFQEIITIEGADPASLALQAATDFLTGVAADELQNLINLWEQIKADVVGIFDGKMPGLEDLNFETIKNLFIAVGADVLVGLLTAVRDLLLRAIDFMGDVIGVLHAALFAKIRFPFIEKLAELVAPGTHLDTSFRLVDAVMLLVSIPSTIAYKLIFQEAPFKRDEPLRLPFGAATAQSLDISGLVPYAGIAGAFFKLGKGGYDSYNAVKGEFGTTKIGIVGGLAFGAIGLAAKVFASRTKEGNVVLALEWAGIGAAMFAMLTSVAVSPAKWGQVKGSNELEAGIGTVMLAAQLGLSTAVFALIIDTLRRSDRETDRISQAPESLLWIFMVFDYAGTILFNSAAMLPKSATKVKLVLIASGTGTRGMALSLKVAQVTTAKLLLDGKA